MERTPIVKELMDAVHETQAKHGLESIMGVGHMGFRIREILETHFSPEAEQDLLEARTHSDPRVRYVVTRTLGVLQRAEWIESSKGKELLLATLKDNDELVRFAGARELGRVSMRDEDVIEALLGLLEDDAVIVRKRAALSLRIVTGKKFWFGKSDPRKWRSWWQANRSRFASDV